MPGCEPAAAVPRADFAIMGGSSTFSIRFPEDLGEPGVEVLERHLVFPTPWGSSPPFKLFRVAAARPGEPDRRVLTVRMHGRREGVSRADASRQVFWVYQQAGVRKIMAEGGVGSANHLLEPRDMVVVTDYIDFSMRRDVGLDGPYLLVMRDPVCPELHAALVEACRAVPDGRGEPHRVFPRGVYANTDGRHFESRAEVAMLRQAGADVIGMSFCPEVYLAREIGACYAGAYMVVNYAEGVVADWRHEDLRDIFYGEAKAVGRILLRALRSLPHPDATAAQPRCRCATLRKPTLLANPPD